MKPVPYKKNPAGRPAPPLSGASSGPATDKIVRGNVDGKSVSLTVKKTHGHLRKFRCPRCHGYCYERQGTGGDKVWVCGQCKARFSPPERLS